VYCTFLVKFFARFVEVFLDSFPFFFFDHAFFIPLLQSIFEVWLPNLLSLLVLNSDMILVQSDSGFFLSLLWQIELNCFLEYCEKLEVQEGSLLSFFTFNLLDLTFDISWYLPWWQSTQLLMLLDFIKWDIVGILQFFCCNWILNFVFFFGLRAFSLVSLLCIASILEAKELDSWFCKLSVRYLARELISPGLLNSCLLADSLYEFLNWLFL